jgi:hypothetical protein
MPSQGVFSNTAPADGEIRVLVQTNQSTGFVTVKSITISDVDRDGTRIVPSLSEINKVLLPISSSGENTTLNITDISEKTGYFFLNNQDVVINDSLSSTNQEISVDPFLIEPFFNNQYNALISNAENTRTNRIRYDVDRANGGVQPDNFNAIVGNPQIDLTLFHQEIGGVFTEETTKQIGSTNTLAIFDEITSPVNSINREDGVRIVCTLANLDNTFDSPVPPVIRIDPTFYTNPSNSATFNIYLYVDFFHTSNTSGTPDVTSLLLTQTYENGVTETIKEVAPINETFSSSTDKLHVRLRQKVVLVSAIGDPSVRIGTFFGMLDRFLNISAVRGIQEPYAPKAPVQDSNYTDTGLINARYNGTKTSEADFSGISPAIAGMSIEASIYPYSSLAADLNIICSSSLADRDMETLLFDGKGTQPTIGDGLVGTIAQPDTLSSVTDTTFRLILVPGTLVTTGDILVLGSNEKVQVLSINHRRKQVNPFTQELVLYDSYVKVVVERGYDGTAAAVQSAGTQVRRIGGSRLYTSSGSRIKPIGRQLVWLKETNTIVSTNDKGFVDSVKAECTV